MFYALGSGELQETRIQHCQKKKDLQQISLAQQHQEMESSFRERARVMTTVLVFFNLAPDIVKIMKLNIIKGKEDVAQQYRNY